jgi:hypothetical protein
MPSQGSAGLTRTLIKQSRCQDYILGAFCDTACVFVGHARAAAWQTAALNPQPRPPPGGAPPPRRGSGDLMLSVHALPKPSYSRGSCNVAFLATCMSSAMVRTTATHVSPSIRTPVVFFFRKYGGHCGNQHSVSTSRPSTGSGSMPYRRRSTFLTTMPMSRQWPAGPRTPSRSRPRVISGKSALTAPDAVNSCTAHSTAFLF